MPQVAVFDDLLADPDAVRASALVAGLGTWRPNKGEVGSSVYDGMGFWGRHADVLRALSGRLGRPIIPNTMFFRVTNTDTEGAYIHSDRESGDATAIVYLSRHEDGASGTAFYRHKETGWVRMPSFAELSTAPKFFERLKRDMVSGDPDKWDQTDFVAGRYNRGVIFPAPYFHARVPKHGFGNTPDGGRMVWASHFYL